MWVEHFSSLTPDVKLDHSYDHDMACSKACGLFLINTLVYLRDGSAQAVARAATLR